jgi:hypothetical protein
MMHGQKNIKLNLVSFEEFILIDVDKYDADIFIIGGRDVV